MRLGIMQPYFFPYLGYFSLIRHTDRFILLDVVQFIRHGWIERNRILKPQEGWQYIQVPLVKHAREARIDEVKIRVGEAWQSQILRQLEHYRKKARYYPEVIAFLETAFSFRTESIADLNAHLLGETCRYLEIPFTREVFSEMGLPIAPVTAPDEWALNICKALEADTYINPPGAVELFDPGKYAQAGVRLQFLQNRLSPYAQGGRPFQEGLSIIDVMMFNTPAEIRRMLEDVELQEQVCHAASS